MSEKIKLSLDLVNDSTCADITVELLIDNQSFYTNKVIPGTHSLSHEVDLEEGDHTFDIILSGKIAEHTKIDESGNIVSDVLVKITNIALDDINIDQLMSEQAVYTHNSNGTTELSDHKFFGPMGCNGTVRLNFTSPFYLWLLSNM
jgi:hypothetical protein